MTPGGPRRPARSTAVPGAALLAEATRALGGTLDLARLMSRLTELTQANLAADAVGVWLLERRGSELALRGAVGFKRPEVVARLAQAPGRDVLGRIVDRPGPVAVRGLPAAARPEARRWIEAEEFQAFLGVPLVGDATPLGMLGLFRRGRRAFTAADLALAESLCVPAAPAILNARLYAEQLRRAERTEILLETAEALGATLDLPAALDDLSRRAARALDAERCTIALWPDGLVPADAPLGEAEASRSKRPVEVDDTLLVVPIVRKGEAIGVLRLTARVRRRWERSAVDLASAIAGQIALVAENARLYREAHAQASELARLYEDAQRAVNDLEVMQRRLVQGETLRALGELASGAAHHLNNLLTIVVGRIQLLRRSVTEERLLRPLEIVERAAKDGAEVVRRLQQFAGMRRTPEPRTVDLNQIVREVIETSRSGWQDSTRADGTDIVVESHLGPLPEITGDPVSLREMLGNLVLNAIDALPGGGRLAVETSATDSTITLTVADTGLGMSEDVRLRAHEPFFTTKGVKSTGLGLSVAFGITRRHGGELVIQSEPGQGTTVRITLPVPAGSAPAASTTAPLPNRALRILLVDDEEEVRKALNKMLTLQGHTVLPAGGGPEALRQLEEDAAIDLVVTDLVMPAMTGWELAAEVKARRPRLAVGVVTGLGDLPEATPGMQVAVDFVLSKPVTLQALADAVSRLSRRENSPDGGPRTGPPSPPDGSGHPGGAVAALDTPRNSYPPEDPPARGGPPR